MEKIFITKYVLSEAFVVIGGPWFMVDIVCLTVLAFVCRL
jgi:hypothetical protein